MQQERLGTAHAALQAAEHFGDGEVAVLYADNPLIRPATLRRLLDSRAPRLRLSLLAFRARRSGPLRPGDHRRPTAWSSASSNTPTPRRPSARSICATPACCGPRPAEMRRWLRAVRNDNAKGEYYLTDVVALARADGRSVAAVEAPADELAGINSRAELAQAEAVLQGWLRAGGDGRRRDDDRSVLGVPVRRHAPVR